MWLSRQHLHTHIKQLFKPIFLASFITPLILQFIILKFSSLATLFKVTSVPVSNYLIFITASAGILVGIKILRKIGL